MRTRRSTCICDRIRSLHAYIIIQSRIANQTIRDIGGNISACSHAPTRRERPRPSSSCLQITYDRAGCVSSELEHACADRARRFKLAPSNSSVHESEPERRRPGLIISHRESDVTRRHLRSNSRIDQPPDARARARCRQAGRPERSIDIDVSDRRKTRHEIELEMRAQGMSRGASERFIDMHSLSWCLRLGRWPP
jgi:hypothetical protein